MKTKIALLGCVIAFAGTISSAGANENAAIDREKLHEAMAGEHRTPANAARDEYRDPAETLQFFGIESDFTVVESWPGGGWYTEILAPYLREEGKLIAATYDRRDQPSVSYAPAVNARYDRLLDSHPEVYDQVEITELRTDTVSEIAESGSVDAILDFRNAHNWIPANAENVITAWHNALKPGGIVGIVDHRRPDDKPAVPGNGYIHESQLVELMEANGFSLAGRSDINANPRDTTDHPGGVWNLPPNLRGVSGEEREALEVVGESNRLTMKFVKD